MLVCGVEVHWEPWTDLHRWIKVVLFKVKMGIGNEYTCSGLPAFILLDNLVITTAVWMPNLDHPRYSDNKYSCPGYTALIIPGSLTISTAVLDTQPLSSQVVWQYVQLSWIIPGNLAISIAVLDSQHWLSQVVWSDNKDSYHGHTALIIPCVWQ